MRRTYAAPNNVAPYGESNPAHGGPVRKLRIIHRKLKDQSTNQQCDPFGFCPLLGSVSIAVLDSPSYQYQFAIQIAQSSECFQKISHTFTNGKLPSENRRHFTASFLFSNGEKSSRFHTVRQNNDFI